MNEERIIVKREKREEYLSKLFTMLRKRDDMIVIPNKTCLNKTEFRLISEVASAKALGERYISTQLAKRLGITRSAISQIVNNLVERNIVKRVPDEIDQKIAYIELTDGILEQYKPDIDACLDFVESLVEEFGEDRFNKMYNELNALIALAERKIEQEKKQQ